MEVDEILDVVLLIAILAILSSHLFMSMTKIYKNNYQEVIEKTALVTKAEINTKKVNYTKEDILLSILVSDGNNNPTIMQINTDSLSPEYNLNEAFVADKSIILNSAYGYLNYSGNVDFELYVGPSGLRKWVIIRE